MNTNPMLNRPIAAERAASFSRRNFLRGLGACFALPTFESLRPLQALAAEAAAQAAPVRMAFLYVPNGTIPAAWWPSGEPGTNFELHAPFNRWKRCGINCKSFRVSTT